MKTVLECIAVLAMTVLCARADEQTYSRIAEVEDLGTIAFPEGKWSLEMRALRTASEAREKPDYFVFKKVDGPLERLTFLRYNPMIAPKGTVACEEAVQGFSRLSLSEEEKKMDGVAVVKFFGTPAKVDRHTSFSWLRIPPGPEPPWLYHAGLYSANQWAIGVIRASTAITDPHTLENVYNLSKFSKRLPEGMHLIPAELAGDWWPIKKDPPEFHIFHLAQNGDCRTASVSPDEMLSGAAEGYYLPSDRILVLDDERFRYDGKTLTFIPGTNATWYGALVYKKSPRDMFSPGSAHLSRRINEGNTLKYEDVDMR
jgi:hypothetical protein